ncbi:hypothetical protein DEJ23_04055 [Curtobacterium sp. MCSS17_008]|uniref:hypothetical protein n=1 Tax=Curtobacterium sp. MCSS17_008 TaxID=2175647 RepID=UPI000DA86297|nr:hypothetical protein [Curtobacterium sp. MCSS17_008]PZF58953.1 hypothetical protein DEJ23_04055 [Curtobacterium sp. MCSS17_008]
MSAELIVRRLTSVALTPLALLILISGCTRHPSAGETPSGYGRAAQVDPETARRKMTELVDRTASELGGEWVTTQGPDYVDSCTLPDGGEGANWVYLVTRTDEGGNPDNDAATVTRSWQSARMTVQRVADPDGPLVVGRGGASTALIDLYAFPGNFTLEAESLCFPGSADEIEEEQSSGS